MRLGYFAQLPTIRGHAMAKTGISALASIYAKAFRRVRPHYDHLFRHFFLASLILLAAILANITWPYLLRDLTNAVAHLPPHGAGHKGIIVLVLLFSGAWLLAQLFGYIRQTAYLFVLNRCDAAFHQALYTRLLRLDFAAFEQQDRGVVVGDISQSKNAFGHLTFTLFWLMLPQLVELVLIFIVLSHTVDPVFGGLYAMAMLAAFVFASKLAARTDNGFMKLVETNNQLTAQTVEKLGVVQDIKLNHAYKQERRILQSRLHNFLHSTDHTNWVMAGFNTLQALQMGAILLGGTLYLAHEVKVGRFTPGDFAMVAGYTIQLSTPFLMMANSLVNVQRHVAALRRGLGYFDLELEQEGRLDVPVRVPGEADGFELMSVRLKAEDRELIPASDIKLSEGRVYAMIGPSGAGKTSLLLTLSGLLKPASGRLLFRGQPIDQMRRESLRDIVAVVPQFPAMINGTLRDNIRYGCNQTVSDTELHLLLEGLGLHSLGVVGKDVLDTDVGDMGNKLSGGERQRIGIARALIRKPDVILLDEPSSALDEETERAMLDEVVRRVSTIIVISHRDSIVRQADCVIRVPGKGQALYLERPKDSVAVTY